MPVFVDPSLAVHPLTVDDVHEMLRAGILGEDDRVELLDGVLAEMSPQGKAHAYAARRLTALAGPVAAAAGLELGVQVPPVSAAALDLTVPVAALL